MDLTAWTDDVHRRALDVDRQFGAQCWDLWSDYAQRVVGVPFARTVTRAGGAGPHGGWACNVLHNAHAAGLGRYFQQLPAGAAGRAGDVAFWERSKRWPGSHVAIVLADLGDRLLTLSQNPGPPQKLLLPKDALLGYLRPRSKAAAAATTPKHQRLEDTPMYRIRDVADGRTYLVTDRGVAHIATPAHNALFTRMFAKAGAVEDLNALEIATIAGYIAAAAAGDRDSIAQVVQRAVEQLDDTRAEAVVDALHERLGKGKSA